MHRQVDGEDIACTRREILVELLQNLQMVNQLCRFLADGNTGAGAGLNIIRQTYLRMKQEMPVCALAVGIHMILIEVINNIHDLHAQLLCLLTVAEASFLALLFKKGVDTLRKACLLYTSRCV